MRSATLTVVAGIWVVLSAIPVAAASECTTSTTITWERPRR